jgi:hypothetical protein
MTNLAIVTPLCPTLGNTILVNSIIVWKSLNVNMQDLNLLLFLFREHPSRIFQYGLVFILMHPFAVLSGRGLHDPDKVTVVTGN